MMNEVTGASVGNPFDDDESITDIGGVQISSMKTTNRSTRSLSHNSNASVGKAVPANPFDDDDDIDKKISSKPFADEPIAEYVNISLGGHQQIEYNKTFNRDWDFEWKSVANAVKKSCTGISVSSPELVSMMLTKLVAVMVFYRRCYHYLYKLGHDLP